MLNIEVGSTDHLDPEVQAMLLAMYSRSYGPISERIPFSSETVQQHKEKLGKFYVQWGHKSVGQLGATTIWLEGVSQLAAKAIEYHNLFNGQESSTRYIDYSNQPIIQPNLTDLNLLASNPDLEFEITRLQNEAIKWQERWRAFYIKALPLTIEKIKAEFPLSNQIKITFNGEVEGQIFKDDKLIGLYKSDEKNNFHIDMIHDGKFTLEEQQKRFSSKETFLLFISSKFEDEIRKTYENTIKARAFDICGGFLPAGVTTNVGFFGTFDTLNDHFGEMLHHPCKEMRDVAVEVLTKMEEKYKFGTMKVDILRDRYSYVNDEYFYPSGIQTKHTDYVLEGDNNNLFAPPYATEFAVNREKYQKFDKVTSSRWNFIFKGVIDFRSYRDLHRHRNGIIDMVVLSPFKSTVSYFYRDNIPSVLIAELSELETSFFKWHQEQISNDPKLAAELQYTVPMAYEMPVTYKCDLNQAMYLVELRSGKTVHQTMRKLAHLWAKALQVSMDDEIKLHVDWDEDNFTLKRGTQTFALPE